ncbi:MAG: glycerate kinase [Bacteroidales bacterium]|nr:glycerate kinase [Bacteroidales bacterium]
MNILIASDSFKHSLSSYEAGKNLAGGIKKILQEAEMIVSPIADGGEGTVQALTDAIGGKQIETQVHDPLMRKITASFGILGDGVTAVIEMASASGIELLTPEERNPLHTTTYGTGELIKAALDHNCSRIILGIGGSATIDAGAGLLAALGAKFPGSGKETILPTGGNLNQIHTIDINELDHRLQSTHLRIGTDVDNPLTGERGAAAVYGPQKGAGPQDVKKLEQNLNKYADLLNGFTGKQFHTLPGAGSAGGLAISLMAFANAGMESGFDLIAEETGLEARVKHADLVITGEGKIDRQTAYGKTACGVARLAIKYNKPLIAVAGTVGNGTDELYNMGFDLILPIIESPVNLETSLREAPNLLENTGMRIGRILKLNDRFMKKDSSS